MFNLHALAAGAVAALFAAPASASVIYNTVHPSTQYSATAIAPTAGPLAISFNVPTATTVRDIQILMNANNPNDGGSVFVYLVPDDGTGGGAGLAGMPLGGAAFTGKTLIGTIADSSLTLAGGTGPGQSAGLVDLPVSLSLAAGEYWLGFTQTTNSAKLVFDTSAFLAGTGTAGQKDFTQTAFGTYSVVTGGGPSNLEPGMRVFQLEISTPEPATLALLGVGMAGLSFVRRRRRS